MQINNPFLVILLILGVYRLSVLISKDTITDPVRLRLGRLAAHNRFWYVIAEWFGCAYCNGIWFAALAAYYMKPALSVEFIIYWMGIAGGQALLLSFDKRMSE